MGACCSIYISIEGESRIWQYKPTEVDKSILYRYAFSPVSDYVLDHAVPSWLAPNTIYILAFLCTFVPHIIIIALLSGHLQGPVPAWLSIITAIFLFLYIILKNVAKKKAEKSEISPLNVFLDHQIDALNIFIIGLSFFSIIQLGKTSFSVIAFIIAMLPFYTATWERYHTGNYDCPKINAQNEGLAIIILIEIITGIFGTEIWSSPELNIIKANDILVLVAIPFSLILIISNVWNVWKVKRRKTLRSVIDLIMIIYTVAMLLTVSYASISYVVSRSARELITYVGLSFAKYVGLLQTSHMSGTKFKFFRYSKFIAFTFLIANTATGSIQASCILDEDFSIRVLMIYEFLRYLSFITGIVYQINDVQKIYKPHRVNTENIKNIKSVVQSKFEHRQNPSIDTDLVLLEKRKLISLPAALPYGVILVVHPKTPDTQVPS